MIGFVSALSSAVAIMILVMTVLLSNKLEIDLYNSNIRQNFKNISGTENSEKENNTYTISVSNFIEADSLKLMDINMNYTIKCSYGFNRDLDSAKKYAVFNFLLIKDFKPNLKLNMQFNKDKDINNSCEVVING